MPAADDLDLHAHDLRPRDLRPRDLQARIAAQAAAPGVDATIERMLHAVRAHLRVDLVYVAELDGDTRHIKYAQGAAPAALPPVKLEAALVRQVLHGTLTGLVHPASQHPQAARLPAGNGAVDGAVVSAPIRFSDGTLFGALTALDGEQHGALDTRDLAAVTMVADIIAAHLEGPMAAHQAAIARCAQLRSLRPGPDLQTVFQPIVSLRSGATVGLEALSRFPTLGLPPDMVFADAWQVGAGADLELTAAHEALSYLPHIPHDWYLSVNLSPQLLTSEVTLAVDVDPHRVVVEVTEHGAVYDYQALTDAAAALLSNRVRVAVDDTGSGHSGLLHILELEPDIIKLDRQIVAGLLGSKARRAMVASMAAYAAQMGTAIVAEGIERREELDVVCDLGVSHGQGYLFGRPAPLREILAA